MSFSLRPYQVDLIEQARTLMQRGVRSILIQAPTGSGKTALTAHMLGTAASKDMNSWFICHRRELIKQSTRTFAEVGIPHGIIAAGFEADRAHRTQICSVQTLACRIGKLRCPRLLVWDEAHHVAATGWARIHAAFPDAFHIGLTATPERLDGAGLGEWFEEIIYGPSVSTLIEQGFLASYKLFAPSHLNLSGIHTRMGDFVRSELASVIDKPTITGDAIAHYVKHADGKRAVVFCVSIAHSKHVVEQFKAVGIRAAHIDGETDVIERDLTLRQFERGQIQVLCNVDLFGEGFDLPSLEVAILLRPTQSLSLYLQQVGRALRPYPGKAHALILDHAGNCERHGLPDEDRQWSLEGRQARKRTGGPSASVRICPKCFAAQFPGKTECSHCGGAFKIKPREVDHVDGDLVEVDSETLKKQRAKEQSKAKTLEELVELGKKRGYKRPRLWAKHVFNARQRGKIA